MWSVSEPQVSRRLRGAAAAVAVLGVVLCMERPASAAPFTHSVVVQRFGGDADFNGLPAGPIGTPGVPNHGDAVALFLDEFSLSSASRLQSIALPTASGDGQRAVTDYYRTDTFTGYLNLSADGSVLVTTGFEAAPGTASVISASPARRPLAIIGMDGSVDTSTTYRWSSSTSQRSVATPDGSTGFYIVTASSAQGTRYVAGTGTTPQQTPAASEGRMHAAAHRTTRIYDGKLFISSGSSTVGPGLAMIDPANPALPTASTSPDYSLPTANFATTAGGSPHQFVLLDRSAHGFQGTTLDTAYIADAGLGLQKWTFDGAQWTLAYTLAGAGGLLGLDYAGDDELGNPILYASTATTTFADGSIGNFLVSVIDSGASSAFATITQSPTNTYFRGVAVVPEPAGLALLALAGVSLLARRRSA